MSAARSDAMSSRRITIARFVLLLAGAVGGGTATAASLSELAALARTILGPGQGVYVESGDGSVLVAQADAIAVHPASVSKVPTTLALLRKFGPDHRFVTTFAAAGQVKGGTLDGDLLVEGDGDPYFVDENALLVALRLNEAGVQTVRGAVRAQGPVIFDWQPDADAARLQHALAGGAAPAAWAAVQALAGPSTSAPPLLRFEDAMRAAMPENEAQAQPLVIHRSQTLLSLLKSLNDYSNNVFKPLAAAAGGPAEVESFARSLVPPQMRAEIQLGDGAGTDARNRLSPRAAVKLLRALEQELARGGHTLADALPVSGIDAGTLHARLAGPGMTGHIAGKSGTFGDYGASALVGAIPTSDLGTVYFAILDHGVPVPEARRRQDRFLRALLDRLHSLPWKYQPDTRPAVFRAQALLAGTGAPP
jgi:D-alanyl-D-alanine carboxypeptidase/D-alanyl-D-alanine-endopeptidase (penicillin-binding protein 4)